jgi:hypothetical protein
MIVVANDGLHVESSVFGLPPVLTVREASALRRSLTNLWIVNYGEPPGNLLDDLERCRKFFDPVARGQTLRDRLSQLLPTPRVDPSIGRLLVDPIAVHAGESRLLVGVEARLLIGLLDIVENAGSNHVIIDATRAAEAERMALELYRRWSRHRLDEVIALRAGAGREVMQAISVGLALALLVNRSTSRERAVVRRNDRTVDPRVNDAIFAAADAFADMIAKRRRRAPGERRLKGGYGLTEARRRLADRLVIEKEHGQDGRQERVYLAAGTDRSAREIIVFLGHDLARRPGLTSEVLAAAFDKLVATYRERSGQLASHGFVHERPADTARLREQLLAALVGDAVNGVPGAGEGTV